MADNLTQAQRSRCMSNIRSTDTKPERRVRQLVHAMGFRFRLHRKDLPGTPDLVFPCRRKVIFIHGCFWHGHSCLERRLPKSNAGYWDKKLSRNVVRDRRAVRALRRAGWGVLTVWECQIRDIESLSRRIRTFLS
jgi:DNA mismatch endonuclease, patch repair protein